MSPLVRHIDLAREFSPDIGPRYKADGPASGEELRERLLVPACELNHEVVVCLDGLTGYTASALEEAFGGLVRRLGPQVIGKVRLSSQTRERLVAQIEEYMIEAVTHPRQDPTP